MSKGKGFETVEPWMNSIPSLSLALSVELKKTIKTIWQPLPSSDFPFTSKSTLTQEQKLTLSTVKAAAISKKAISPSPSLPLSLSLWPALLHVCGVFYTFPVGVCRGEGEKRRKEEKEGKNDKGLIIISQLKRKHTQQCAHIKAHKHRATDTHW